MEHGKEASDPLARLAEQLEKLAEAHLALGEQTVRLIPQAAPDERRFLREAASASRAAARQAATTSAELLISGQR
ncbi:MAG: hypothetical protein V9E83_06910 [Baekduia sp.]